MVSTRNFLLLIASILLAACSHTPISVLGSSEPVEPGRYQKLGASKGESCYFKIFGLIPVSQKQSSLNEAINNAKNVHDGTDALVQISVDEYMKHWLLASKHCTTVSAISVRIM